MLSKSMDTPEDFSRLHLKYSHSFSKPSGTSSAHLRHRVVYPELLALCCTSGAVPPVEIDFSGRIHEHSGCNQA